MAVSLAQHQPLLVTNVSDLGASSRIEIHAPAIHAAVSIDIIGETVDTQAIGRGTMA